MARWLNIDAKHRRSLGMHASLADFTLGRTEPAEPSLATTDTKLSLYCLDHERREAIFVELPTDRGLADAAFLYAHQYDMATRLLSMPYPEFLELSERLGDVERFVMIYMTGRSGSTLLSHALNQVKGVVSLSEPDVPIGLVHVQRAKAASPEEMRALLRASVRFLFRKGDGSLPSVCALKMRNESIQLVDLIRAAFPQGTSLFLYRDAIGWVGSMYRIFVRLNVPEWQTVSEARDTFDLCYGIDVDRFLPLLGHDAPRINLIEFLTLWWIVVIEQYLEAVERGFEAAAFRHEDISRRPDRSLPEILRICQLASAEVEHAMKAYEQDSQASTPLSAATAEEAHLTLTTEQTALVRTIVARHPIIRDAGVDVPGTIRFS